MSNPNSAPVKKKSVFRPNGISGFAVATGVFLIEAILVALLLVADILPLKYLIAMIGIMILIDFGLLAMLGKGGNVKLLGMVISLVVICVFTLGGFYVTLTNSAFAKISKGWLQVERYYVIAAKGGSYDKLEDIKGKEVYTIKGNSKMYAEAKGKLISKADVSYKEVGDCIEAGNKLVDENGQTYDNLIFVSNGFYEMICEEIDGFEDKTKILHTITVKVKENNDKTDIDVTKESFNLYITGIDNFGDIEQTGRSDVNMIVSVNPKTRNILLTSIPRDSYVVLHSFGQYDKLTHSGIYGVDETLSTVEDWMGIDVHYYCRVDFSMLRRLVNAVDGIDVYSKYEFDSDLKPFHYKKGWNHLNGDEALYFARERHAFPEDKQDQTRIRNQQRVMKALINKVTSSKVILMHYGDILEAIEGTMQTSLSSEDISALVKMQLNDMSEWNIKTQAIDGEGSEQGTMSMGMGRMLYVFIPDEKSVADASRNINKVLYPSN